MGHVAITPVLCTFTVHSKVIGELQAVLAKLWRERKRKIRAQEGLCNHFTQENRREREVLPARKGPKSHTHWVGGSEEHGRPHIHDLARQQPPFASIVLFVIHLQSPPMSTIAPWSLFHGPSLGFPVVAVYHHMPYCWLSWVTWSRNRRFRCSSQFSDFQLTIREKISIFALFLSFFSLDFHHSVTVVLQINF